jgi:hypothetical protein
VMNAVDQCPRTLLGEGEEVDASGCGPGQVIDDTPGEPLPSDSGGGGSGGAGSGACGGLGFAGLGFMLVLVGLMRWIPARPRSGSDPGRWR